MGLSLYTQMAVKWVNHYILRRLLNGFITIYSDGCVMGLSLYTQMPV